MFGQIIKLTISVVFIFFFFKYSRKFTRELLSVVFDCLLYNTFPYLLWFHLDIDVHISSVHSYDTVFYIHVMPFLNNRSGKLTFDLRHTFINHRVLYILYLIVILCIIMYITIFRVLWTSFLNDKYKILYYYWYFSVETKWFQHSRTT